MLVWFLKDIILSILYNIFVPYMFSNISLFVMYIKILIDRNNVIIIIDVINNFLFIFMYFRSDIKIIIYIMIEPVSGSRKVNIEGIIVIIRSVMIDLFFIAYVDNISINDSLVSSLGWKEKFNICIHAFEPFIERPNIRTYISNIVDII